MSIVFGAVMIVLNGMVGLSLVLGGQRHHEQTYNLQGANAFLAVILRIAASFAPSITLLHLAGCFWIAAFAGFVVVYEA